MSEKPWMETWVADIDDVRLLDPKESHDGWPIGNFTDPRRGSLCDADEARAKLAAAAPALARALCEVEWDSRNEDGYDNACPSCDMRRHEGHYVAQNEMSLFPSCALNEALNEAGLTSQELREEVRRGR